MNNGQSKGQRDHGRKKIKFEWALLWKLTKSNETKTKTPLRIDKTLVVKKFYVINILLIFLTACSGLKEAGKVLRNEKIRTTDEFLVKKRNPLVLTPNYEEVIKPGEILKKKQEQEDDIKKLLKAVETKDDKKPPSSIENSILNKIKKWKIII